MSRSYKFPASRDVKKKYWKRQANKVVRRYDSIIDDGSSYKRLYCSWNISDYNWIADTEEWKAKLSRK